VEHLGIVGRSSVYPRALAARGIGVEVPPPRFVVLAGGGQAICG
jgi:hypothetical protein